MVNSPASRPACQRCVQAPVVVGSPLARSVQPWAGIAWRYKPNRPTISAAVAPGASYRNVPRLARADAVANVVGGAGTAVPTIIVAPAAGEATTTGWVPDSA